MKKLFFILLLIGAQELAQAQMDFPRASPRTNVSLVLGYTTISIAYGSPAVKGRKIWGDVVPYKEVWRTGANEATTIQFDDDVKISGNAIPKGRYGLFAIPDVAEWTIIFNKNPDQWGAFRYDARDDLLRIKVKPVKTIDVNERLVYTIVGETENIGWINLLWENIKISFPLEVEIREHAIKNIKETFNKFEDRWSLLEKAAGYYSDNNIDQAQAIKWIDESIALNNKFFGSYWTKGRILANQKKYQEAIVLAEKSLLVGQANRDGYFDYAKSLIEKDIEDWEKKS